MVTRILILAIVLFYGRPTLASAQTWQPTTWPPEPAPICKTANAPEWPGGCVGMEQMRAEWTALNYNLQNQRAIGYGVDVPMDLAAAGYYGQRQGQQWNAATGRYDNESWMWTPAPQAQQQWLQQRRAWR